MIHVTLIQILTKNGIYFQVKDFQAIFRPLPVRGEQNQTETVKSNRIRRFGSG